MNGNAPPCELVQRELATLIEPDGAPDALEEHLDACDRCALDVDRARRTARALSTLGDGFVAPADMARRALDAVGAPRRRRPGPLPLALGAAALVLLGVAVIIPATRTTPTPTRTLWIRVGQGPLEQRDGQRWRAVAPGSRLDLRRGPIRNPAAARATAALLDGAGGKVTARLLLGRGATLAARGQSPRLLRGELLADVAPRGARPPLTFQVPGGQVEVVGTKLHLSAERDLTLVDVIHGAVRIVSDAGAALVDAGQQGALTRSRRPAVSMAPDLGRTLAWTRAEGPAADPLPAGLGSLTAHRPGRAGDRPLPLRLAEHVVEVRVQGALARTEITETFVNPTGQTLEGVYRFPLPPGARVSRLALYVDGRLEEGTIVERDRASKIWRGVLRQATPARLRKKREEYIWVPGPWRDPALLQWREGNQFELRIFPIPARGSRKVVLAYTESLPRTARGRRYVYPLPTGSAGGALRTDHFRLSIELGGHDPLAPLHVSPRYPVQRRRAGETDRLTLEQSPFDPAGDLVVDFATEAARSPLVVQSYRPRGTEPGYVRLSLEAQLPAYSSDRPRDVLLLVDRSQSTVGEAGRRALMLARAMIEEMDSRDRLAVLACDGACRPVGGPWGHPAPALADRIQRALGRVRPGGATDLGEALRRAGELLERRDGRRPGRVIYVGDGVPTLGERQPGALAALARRYLGPSRARLTTVGVGASVDATVLRAMARAGAGGYVAYGPGMTVRGQALQVLARQYGVVLEQARLELPEGLTEVAPKDLPLLRQGEELVIVGRASGPIHGELVLTGRVNGEPYRRAYPVSVRPGRRSGNTFLPRLWAQLTIERLLGEGTDQRRRVVELSKRHYLLTRYTSLLVLESQAMRRAFGVAQGRRAEDWTGEEQAVSEEQPGRRAGGLTAAPTDPHTTDPLAGLGAGDTGGHTAFQSAPQSGVRDHVPGSVVPGGRPARVAGALDKEIIRRVIRRHINDVKRIYERQLKTNPGLAGRLALRFTIGPDGRVASVSVQNSSLGSAPLERDLARAVGRWRFPAPAGGGVVHVSYPLVFRSAGDGDPPGDRVPPAIPPPRGTRWVRMRREHYQEAELRDHPSTTGEARLVALRRRRLAERPESRDRHRDLVHALSRAGRAAEALELLQRWLEKAPNDDEPLALLAETAARLGQRERALRALGSLLELHPDSAPLLARLARVHQARGATRTACACWISLGQVRRSREAEQRSADCRDGYKPPRPGEPRGSVVLDGRWQQPADLDLALVSAAGRRLSWLGDRGRPSFADVTRPDRERLAFRWLPPGRYLVEVSRGAASGGAVRGRLALRAPGLSRRLRFALASGEQRAYVAELRIHRRTRLVPAGF